jgi:hypothetical protein
LPIPGLRHASKHTLLEKFIDNKYITNEECKRFTCLNKNEFYSIVNELKTLKESQAGTKSQALATYLFWLKTGLSYRTIATLFSIDNFQTVGQYCNQVRLSLLTDFVPKNLGVSHMTREEWVQQNTILAKELYDVPDDKFILVADGTYLYHEKPADNEFQRQSYSLQKGRHLSKPFVICATNGKIIDIYGLFPAVYNDAKIIDTLLKSNKELRQLIKPNDHVILDRGFRNIISTLQNKYKLITHMPTCKSPKQNQLTTAEANESRLTTKCRFVVETINGKLKKTFRANGMIHRNVTLQHSLDDFRIAAAITNNFFIIINQILMK